MRITNLDRASIYPDLTDRQRVALPGSEREGLRTGLRVGDILISITADIGIIGYVDERVPLPAYINQHVACLRLPSDQVCPKFVAYYLASAEPQKRFVEMTDVGAKTGISLTTVSKLTFPCPPLNEQRVIAAALSDADGVVAGLERVIAKKRLIKQGAMQDLLTARRRLPGFSGEWKPRPLSSVSAFITKGATPTTYGFGWEAHGILFLRSECVSPRGLDLSQSMFISEKAHRATKRSEVAGGDILITITGNVGRVVRLPNDFGQANINQHIARIRITSGGADPDFVFHQLSRPEYLKHFNSIITGQAYPQISLQQVREAEVYFPEDQEQLAIAQFLNDMDAEIQTLESRLAKARAVKEGMMQNLLTARIRLV
ncbi:restriction endonuclease subunit S [Cereibacter sphaeroides]|uniref:restriction endonuclease subunit S n=1 Tax=Cereibacter sphaeroides TaxID=1063 RepID=UPI001558C1BF|nr:restriction endonuclease subunit S [Cereibacter sphaeroides]